jgi:acyl-CoA thioesterase II
VVHKTGLPQAELDESWSHTNDSFHALPGERTFEANLTPRRISPLATRAFGPVGSSGRIYGGGLLAHFIVAASATSHQGGRPHSIHAHFLRSGAPLLAVDYAAEVIRSSKRFTTTRLDASQHGALIATATVSFHSAETSREHAGGAPAAGGDPTEAPEANGGPIPPRGSSIRAPFDLRRASSVGDKSIDGRPVVGYWVRVRQPLNDVPALHAAALAWASDFALTRIADLEHEHREGGRQAASIDHAMWFHRVVDMNDWLYYELTSPIYREALALSIGRVFDRRGNLVATVTQESLLRRD